MKQLLVALILPSTIGFVKWLSPFDGIHDRRSQILLDSPRLEIDNADSPIEHYTAIKHDVNLKSDGV